MIIADLESTMFTVDIPTHSAFEISLIGLPDLRTTFLIIVTKNRELGADFIVAKIDTRSKANDLPQWYYYSLVGNSTISSDLGRLVINTGSWAAVTVISVRPDYTNLFNYAAIN